MGYVVSLTVACILMLPSPHRYIASYSANSQLLPLFRRDWGWAWQICLNLQPRQTVPCLLRLKYLYLMISTILKLQFMHKFKAWIKRLRAWRCMPILEIKIQPFQLNHHMIRQEKVFIGEERAFSYQRKTPSQENS